MRALLGTAAHFCKVVLKLRSLKQVGGPRRPRLAHAPPGTPPGVYKYNTYRAHPWSPFPLRRAHPGPGPHKVLCPARSRAKMEQLEILPESQSQNLALTVLYVPCSLGVGRVGCVKSLRSSYTGLYPQKGLPLFAPAPPGPPSGVRPECPHSPLRESPPYRGTSRIRNSTPPLGPP